MRAACERRESTSASSTSIARYWQKAFTEDDLHLADALAAHVSAGIECAQLLRRQRELFLQTISALASAIEMRDAYTGGHTARVTAYSLLVGEELGLSPRSSISLRTGGPLHDIGKIGIDDAILRKPDKLTDAEFDVMKSHTTLGDDILKAIPEMKDIRPIVRSHHERWDGRGYPDKTRRRRDSALGARPRRRRLVRRDDHASGRTTRTTSRRPEQAFAEVAALCGHPVRSEVRRRLPDRPRQGAGSDANDPDDGVVLRADQRGVS